MKYTKEEKTTLLRTAKLRRIAKEFRNSIPIGFGCKLTDEIIDELKDSEVSLFYSMLNQLGLIKVGNFWERA